MEEDEKGGEEECQKEKKGREIINEKWEEKVWVKIYKNRYRNKGFKLGIFFFNIKNPLLEFLYFPKVLTIYIHLAR